LDDLIVKYRKRQYVQSLLLTDKTDLTAVSWRIKLKDNNRKKLKTQKRSLSEEYDFCTVAYAASEFGSNDSALKHVRENSSKSTCSISQNPSLGVLITCYNNRKTIKETIYSVLSQSKTPDLVVVADDCSTDGSSDLLNFLAAKYSNIKLILRPVNLGVAANRDLAIRDMGTDYITTLDGDDLFLPGKLELEYHTLLRGNTQVAISDIAMLTCNGNNVVDTTAYSRRSKKDIIEMLISRSEPVPRDMMFTKELFLKAGGFDVSLSIYEDWSLKMRLINASDNNSWIHSGGIGTVYDRRDPGLSGDNPTRHAYAQLLALARNINILKIFPDAVSGGLASVSKHLSGDLAINFQKFNKDINVRVKIIRMESFCENAIYHMSDDTLMLQQINKMIT